MTQESVSEIFFIGGVHGVGKTTVCAKICDRLAVEHLVASTLIKEVANKRALETDPGKRVSDVQGNQDLLLVGLSEHAHRGKRYLLDGHYVVLRRDNTVQPVPIATFEAIAPKQLLILLGRPEDIVERLQSRGTEGFDVAGISKMQDAELSHAMHVSERLGIPLIRINPSELETVIARIAPK